MNADDEMQKRFVEAENLRAQSQAIQQQDLIVVNTLQELKNAKTALENLDSIPKESETLIPLGGGVFINAKLASIENVVLNLGANVMVNKDRKEAIKVIESQIDQLEDAKAKLDDAVKQIEARMTQLSLELQLLASASKQK